MASYSLQPKNSIAIGASEDPIQSPGPCILLFTNPMDYVTVETAGGDIVTFQNIQGNSYLPVQVVRLIEYAGSGTILALW